MKFRLAVPILALLSSAAFAQTSPIPTTYIWNGSTDSSVSVGLYSVDGVPTFSSGGWGGSIQIVGGTTLNLLQLPQPGVCSTNGLFDPNCTGIVMPFLPNESRLGGDGTTIAWGDKQWGTRTDGTTMDGTQSGDFYDLLGSTTSALWNGSAAITLDQYHQFEFRKVCIRHSNRTCTEYGYVLKDIYVGGSGTAVGTPNATIASLYRCGSNRSACPLTRVRK